MSISIQIFAFECGAPRADLCRVGLSLSWYSRTLVFHAQEPPGRSKALLFHGARGDRVNPIPPGSSNTPTEGRRTLKLWSVFRCIFCFLFDFRVPARSPRGGEEARAERVSASVCVRVYRRFWDPLGLHFGGIWQTCSELVVHRFFLWILGSSKDSQKGGRTHRG